MRDLILQPALLHITNADAVRFIQFSLMPGAPVSDDSMLNLSKCEVCGEWSPQATLGARLCRACGKRRGGRESVSLCTGMALMNGWAEVIEIREQGDFGEPFFFTGDGSLEPMDCGSFLGLFNRVVSGPCAT
jgi:hypothetical protein